MHSIVCLRGTRSISKDNIDSWKSTQMLIIDEVSFLSEHIFNQTNTHMRILKGGKDIMFGGCHIILIGNFFQLSPMGGVLPLFKSNTINMERGVLVLKHNTKFRRCIASKARRAEDAIPVFCTKPVG